MSERDQSERAGRSTGPGRRPTRRMRERADEMAALLAHAAPDVHARRRRRSTAIPAAVMALGALTVGGVGVAVGLDTQTADAGIAEGLLPVPDPAAPVPDGPPRDAATGVSVRDDDGDSRSRGAAPTDGARRAPGTDAGVAHRAAPVVPRAPARPRVTATTAPGGTDRGADRGADRDEAGDDRPRSTTSSPRSTSAATSTRPTGTHSGRDRSDATPRSGRGTAGATGLHAGSRGARGVLPPASPTGDGE